MKLRKITKNKKGQFSGMLIFFIAIAFILVIGLFIGIAGSSISMFMDEFVPEIKSIGSIGASNVTQYAGYALDPLDTFVNSWTWLGGVLYLISFIGLFGLAVGYKATMNKWYMGLFVMFALLIIFLSIFISNVYQNLYEDNSDFGNNIKDQKLLSFLLLHSPLILCIIVFASGIVLFSGLGQEEGI